MIAFVSAAPASAECVATWRPIILDAARRFALPAAWIERVMQAESAGRTRLGGRPITSRAGAMGLMQLMPATWAAMRARLGLGSDPYDPRDNILAGTFYLRLMHDRFGYPGLFAAYNAGPARYAATSTRGTPLPAETLAYLRKVTGDPRVVGTSRTGPNVHGLFAIRLARAASDRLAPAPAGARRLFAIAPR